MSKEGFIGRSKNVLNKATRFYGKNDLQIITGVVLTSINGAGVSLFLSSEGVATKVIVGLAVRPRILRVALFS